MVVPATLPLKSHRRPFNTLEHNLQLSLNRPFQELAGAEVGDLHACNPLLASTSAQKRLQFCDAAKFLPVISRVTVASLGLLLA